MNYPLLQQPIIIPSDEKIWDEFLKGSAIAPEVAKLNLKIIPDVEFDPITHEVTGTPLADLLNRKFTRFGHQANKAKAIGFFNENGTLWHSKIYDGKPNKKGKTGNYTAPTGIGDVPYLPTIPKNLVQAIAAEHGLEPPAENESFWEWFKNHKQIPLILTEGGKKTLAPISEGLIALALFGASCGVAKDPIRVKPSLLPYVEGREVRIAFDQDTKPKTIRKVNFHTQQLAYAIGLAGGKPKIVSWDGHLGKGLDDLIANNPAEFHKAIANAVPVYIWDLEKRNSLAEIRDLKIHDRHLPQNLPIPEETKIVIIKSAKNTGKTQWLVNIVAKAIRNGQRIYVVTHRIQLAKHLCKRFGIDHIEKIKISDTKGCFGYGLCIDSLHEKSKARFDANEAENALIIFDEVDQILWHTLGGDTCQENRVPILQTLEDMVKTAIGSNGKLYLSSADVSPKDINYFSGLANHPKQFVIENTYIPNKGKRTGYQYQSEAHLMTDCRAAIARGEQVIIHLSAQKPKSKWGTINVEKILKNAFPDKKILRIDSYSVAQPDHPAFSCMENLDDVVQEYDIVIASPTIETGVSIDCEHFDSVWAIANGVQTVNAVCQTLERVRSHVPRHFFIKERSKQRIGNGATYAKGLMKSNDQKFTYTLGQIHQAEILSSFDGNSTQHLQTWAEIAAELNLGFIHYREMILHKMRSEGYEIIELAEDESKTAETKDIAKSVKDATYLQHREKVVAKPNPTDQRLDLLRDKRNKTEDETIEEQKGILCRRYLTEDIDIALIEEDDNGLYPKLQLLYYLTIGEKYLEQRDIKAVTAIAHKGQVFSPDANKVTITAKKEEARLLLDNLPKTPDGIYSKDSLTDWHETYIKPNVREIKTTLGISMGKMTPIEALQAIYQLMGLKMICVGKNVRRKGKQVNLYQLPEMKPSANHESILNRWYERDLAATPPHNDLVKTGGVAEEKKISPVQTEPEPAPVATAIAPIIETSPDILNAVQDAIISLTQGNRNPMTELCCRLHNFSVISKAAFELDQLGAVGMNTNLIRLWMSLSTAIA